MTKKDSYSENFDQASQHLRQAIAILSKYKIPPSPHNFQVFYEFVAGKNQALNKQLQALINDQKNIDSDILDSLYEEFFAPDRETIEIIRQELKQIINKLQDEFGISVDNLSNYAKSLDHFVEILDNAEPFQETLHETEKVLAETNQMEIANQQMEVQLARVVDEVNSLRDELDQVKEEAMTDTLTRIANRKAFDLSLEQIIFDARESRKTFSLLMADIDHFKQFNDTYGHLVGDKVLRFVANIIKCHIKGNDTVSRYGGEEFALILPNTNSNGAVAIANQLREAVAQGELKDKANGGNYGRVTMSVGVAQFRASDLANALLQRADKALYLAKERGRNRVERL